ncbi:MAG TPA: lytic transglycosylase domain-containing protein [Pseudomonadales bacterium]
MTHPLPVLLLLGLGLILNLRAEAAGGYPYQSCFEIASRLHDVPLDVLLAVAATESAWNPDARSHADAHGIMQIQWPGTAQHLGVTRLAELYNPCLNIELGARYLRELLDRSDGDLTRALAAYNYGPGRIAGQDALPAGASRYVARVHDQRDRIRRDAEPAAARVADAAGAVMRFDHPARARRFAETLNARVASARFDLTELDGGWGVTMRVEPAGLSLEDVTLLESLGWASLAGDAR